MILLKWSQFAKLTKVNCENTLKVEKSIRGQMTEAGTTVDVGDLVAQSLIDSGAAVKFGSKPKKTKAES